MQVLDLSRLRVTDSVALKLIQMCEGVRELRLNHAVRVTGQFLSRLPGFLEDSLLQVLELVPREGSVDLALLLAALEGCLTLEAVRVGREVDWPEAGQPFTDFQF